MKKQVFKTPAGQQIIQKYYLDLLNNWPVDYQMQSISTNQGKTNIIISGDPTNPPLLLLHGTSSNSATWMGDVAQWSQKYRVFAVDIPGEPGLSAPVRLKLAGNAFSDWLNSLFEELSISATHVVGMSLGGWAALKLATTSPSKIKSIVLIASSGLAPAKMSFLFKAFPLFFLGNWGLKKINQMVYGNLNMPQEAIDFSHLIAKNFIPVAEPVPVFSNDELCQLNMPILYIGGKEDVLLNTSKSAERLTNLLPHAKVIQLANTGHVVINQTQTILDFLDKTKK
ncbi:MAG: alpha/beta hydrolase [Spirochaetes bacterium]|nr:alpha/beta hydrolase [Spirochaetota bacterium]